MNTEKRNYYTLQELMDETMKLVKDDPEYPKALARCPLDYQSVSSSVKDERITLCEFNVLGFTEYGGSEGIYGTICFQRRLVAGLPHQVLWFYWPHGLYAQNTQRR